MQKEKMSSKVNTPEKITNMQPVPVDNQTVLLKKLDERLSDIELPVSDEINIVKDELMSVIIDAATSIVPGGEAIKKFLETQENIDTELNNRKKELLLEQYLNKTDQHEKAVIGLANLMLDMRGQLLYKQIESKMQAEIPSPETTDILANTLKKVLDSDLASEFEAHKAVVTTITRMDIKSLMILRDHEKWPIIKSKPNMMESFDAPDTSTDWAFRYAKEYLKTKGLTDEAMIYHVRTCIMELFQEGCAMAKPEVNGNDFALVTSFGNKILEYIAYQNNQFGES